jgi:hypothetical protein
MEARRLIAGASVGPDALKVLFQAYDEAWALLAPRCGNDQSVIETARLRLANIVLGLMREDTRDVTWLRDAALQHYETVAEIVLSRLDNAKHWRDRANDTLVIANQIENAEAKMILLGIANGYAQLARMADARKPGKTGPLEKS